MKNIMLSGKREQASLLGGENNNATIKFWH